MTSSEKRKRQKEKAGAKRCGAFELSLHKVPYFWQTITFLILMVVTFVPLGHVVLKKIPKNTNIETFKLFAAEHYIISSGFIGRFFIFDIIRIFWILTILVTILGVCICFYLVILITFDNYDHFFVSGLSEKHGTAFRIKRLCTIKRCTVYLCRKIPENLLDS